MCVDLLYHSKCMIFKSGLMEFNKHGWDYIIRKWPVIFIKRQQPWTCFLSTYWRHWLCASYYYHHNGFQPISSIMYTRYSKEKKQISCHIGYGDVSDYQQKILNLSHRERKRSTWMYFMQWGTSSNTALSSMAAMVPIPIHWYNACILVAWKRCTKFNTSNLLKSICHIVQYVYNMYNQGRMEDKMMCIAEYIETNICLSKETCYVWLARFNENICFSYSTYQSIFPHKERFCQCFEYL